MELALAYIAYRNSYVGGSEAVLLADAILAAVAEEREACAKIAEQFNGEPALFLRIKEIPGGNAISSAIRNSPTASPALAGPSREGGS